MVLENYEVSVVLPCYNEQESIAACVEKIKGVFAKENIHGEIIVVDNNSTDSSARIAKQSGAEIVFQPIKGYGAAYIKGLETARAPFIIMGDADNTYDFNDIPRFLEKLRSGYGLVMGSRFKGKIHKGAMPWANRYIGNPILSGLCRLFFRTKLSDIHCGMRGFTKEAYLVMNLRCLGMEFATEMVMEALQKKLKITEIPIDYYPRGGESKLRPIRDAWRHMRFMLIFCPTWLYLFPGLFLTVFGILGLFLLAPGPFMFLGRFWDIHVMVLCSLLSIFGYQLMSMGMFAKTFAVKEGYLAEDKTFSFLAKNFKLETGLFLGFVFFLFGFSINFLIFIEWWQKAFGALFRIRETILAVTLMIVGLQTMFSSFFVSLIVIER
ncbi:MAG: glycosyltransferase family 2 protein [Candidatus Omnitrophota bacterium]